MKKHQTGPEHVALLTGTDPGTGEIYFQKRLRERVTIRTTKDLLKVLENLKFLLHKPKKVMITAENKINI